MLVEAAQVAAANHNLLYINVDPCFYTASERNAIQAAGGIFTSFQYAAYDQFVSYVVLNITQAKSDSITIPVQANPVCGSPAGVAGVVNSASFSKTVAPGSLVSAFVTNSAAINGIFSATGVPLPTALQDALGNTVTAYVSDHGNYSAEPANVPLLAIAGNTANVTLQVNFLLPPDLDTSKGTAHIRVETTGVAPAEADFSVAAIAPAVYVVDQQNNIGAVLSASTGEIADSGHPVAPGDFASIYASGLGPVTPAEPFNQAAPDLPLSYTNQPFYVFIGGVPVKASFSGLAPGYVGLYQINVQIPMGIKSGLTQLYLSADSNQTVVSPPVNVYVQ